MDEKHSIDTPQYAVGRAVPELTYVICIQGKDYKLLAGIKPDGTIEYGPNYSPDETARTFWEAMGKGWLGFLAPIVEREVAARIAAATDGVPPLHRWLVEQVTKEASDGL